MKVLPQNLEQEAKELLNKDEVKEKIKKKIENEEALSDKEIREFISINDIM